MELRHHEPGERALARLPGTVDHHHPGVGEGRRDGTPGVPGEQGVDSLHVLDATACVVDLPTTTWLTCRKYRGGSADHSLAGLPNRSF